MGDKEKYKDQGYWDAKYLLPETLKTMKELGVEMTIWEIHFYEKYDVLEKYGFYGNA